MDILFLCLAAVGALIAATLIALLLERVVDWMQDRFTRKK